MNETAITLAGNTVAAAELRYTATGVAVANLRVASTARFYDKAAGAWKDGDTLFLTVNCWRDLAEHVAETVHKGDRVIVTGRIKQRTYEGKDGSNVTMTEVEASDVGVSLQRVTAKLAKTERSHGDAGNGFGGAPEEPPF